MRVAIIGVGAIAEIHARALADISSIELVSACCRTEEKGLRFAEQHDCSWYPDPVRMIRREKPDVVTIATPSGAHLEVAIKAIRKGVHVLCEKPLEITTRRIDRMIRAAEKAGVSLGAIFPQRFNPVLQAVHAASAAGRFGDLAVASSAVPWWRDDAYYGKGRWQGTLALDGGGALMNQSIHGVDALQWIAGASMPDISTTTNPIESVAAFTALKSHSPECVEVEDTCLAVLKLKNGGLGQLLATTSLFPGQLRRFIFGGRGGTAEIEEEQIVNWQFQDSHSDDDAIRSRFGATSGTSGGAADPMAINYSCHTRNFSEFFDAVSAGIKPKLDGHEGRKAVAIIEACYKSATTGKVIKITD